MGKKSRSNIQVGRCARDQDKCDTQRSRPEELQSPRPRTCDHAENTKRPTNRNRQLRRKRRPRRNKNSRAMTHRPSRQKSFQALPKRERAPKPRQLHREKKTTGLKMGNTLLVFTSRTSRRPNARDPSRDAEKQFLVSSRSRRSWGGGERK